MGDICNFGMICPADVFHNVMPQTESNLRGMPLSHSNPDPSRIRIRNNDGILRDGLCNSLTDLSVHETSSALTTTAMYGTVYTYSHMYPKLHISSADAHKEPDADYLVDHFLR
jgi:hypothetical protein